MSTAADYLGRTVDVLAFYGAEPTGEQLLTQALALPTSGGAIITGIEKLVQRFLPELLTELGSLVFLPQRGCSFMTDARRGIWRTQFDVSQSFYAAMVLVSRNLIQEEKITDPEDERFAEAVLTRVTIQGTSVSISVSIASLAGSLRTIFTPLF